MGSIVEINDSLVITREQGFPKELDLVLHLKKPFSQLSLKTKFLNLKIRKISEFIIVRQLGISW